MRKFTQLFAVLLIAFSLQGCVATSVRDAIDAADDHVRLKWSEEWKPALLSEISTATDEAKDEALTAAISRIESYEAINEERLRQININLDDFDANKDGELQSGEAVALLQELKNKNLSWWEILAIFAGAYLPLTGGKEYLKSKMSGTGDGSVTS